MATYGYNDMAHPFQETLTEYAGVISSDHAYIHLGKGKTVVVDLGSISATQHIGFTTPTVASDVIIHWRPTGITSSANYIEATLTEGDSYSGGTDITSDIFTRNRLLADSTYMQAFAKGVTATPTGLVVQSSGIGTSGNTIAQSGGGTGAENELVLKQNTDYVLTIIPDGATEVILTLFWYEEDLNGG